MSRTRLLNSSAVVAIALGLTIATPAAAQQACDLNGAAQTAPTGAGSLYCGTPASTSSDNYQTNVGNFTATQGDGSTVLGWGNLASTTGGSYGWYYTGIESATAIGFDSAAFGLGTVALGDEATAAYFDGTNLIPADHAIAIGSHTFASAVDTVALGYSSDATAAGAIAIGANASASGTNSVALGVGSSDGGYINSVALGAYSTATADNQVNVGGRTIGGLADGVLADDAATVGQMQVADAALQANIDAEAAARAAADATLQANVDAEASARIAADTTLQSNIDAEATARSAADAVHTADIAAINADLYGNSISFGAGSSATVNAVAIGVGQTATGNGAVAIGDPNTAIGTGAVAIGADNTATGDGAVAMGNLSSAIGQGAVALGNGSTATGEGSVAIGDGAVSGTNGVAMGNGASNGAFTNSVALGAGATNTANNQVAVGGRTISGVAAGALNATSTEAVVGSQLFATNQAVAANTAAIAAINTGIAGMQSDIDTLFDLRSEDRRDMKQGVASAVAIANAPMPSNPGGVSYAVNGATFRGEYAVGGSLSYRLNTQAPMSVNVGFSYAGNKNNSARVGVAGEF